jgi:fructose/tagatose bisphosphate aldolase
LVFHGASLKEVRGLTKRSIVKNAFKHGETNFNCASENRTAAEATPGSPWGKEKLGHEGVRI